MELIHKLRRSQLASWITLLTSSGTLICCALPALLVVAGAGAALASAIAAVPQLVWFSEHKTGVFLVALAMLIASGVSQWQARSLPCPADPELAHRCRIARRRSQMVYALSVGLFALGGFFAFIAPLIL